MARTSGFNKRAPRIDVHRQAVLINSDGVQTKVTVLDISSSGFRLHVSEPLRIGEFVTLRVEHSEEVPAQIRWALGDEAGGVFLAPVAYEQLT
jgi:hypothetical protein